MVFGVGGNDDVGRQSVGCSTACQGDDGSAICFTHIPDTGRSGFGGVAFESVSFVGQHYRQHVQTLAAGEKNAVYRAWQNVEKVRCQPTGRCYLDLCFAISTGRDETIVGLTAVGLFRRRQRAFVFGQTTADVGAWI